MRRRRPDGTLVTDLAAYRRIMPYLMRGRNESAVAFEQALDLSRTQVFLDAVHAARPDLHCTLFHVVTWALVQTFDRRPRLNRFVAGGRLYQRDGIWVSYSAKKQMVDGAPLVVVKRRFDPAEPFPDLVAAMADDLAEERADRPSVTDRELGLLLRLPGPALRGVLALERLADALGILPAAFIEHDPMFASMFIANLGSLKMDAASHHLYEYGSVGVFCVVGRTGLAPVVGPDGEVRSRPGATLRFTFDERVEDGMYAHGALELLQGLVEDPAAELGDPATWPSAQVPVSLATTGAMASSPPSWTTT